MDRVTWIIITGLILAVLSPLVFMPRIGDTKYLENYVFIYRGHGEYEQLRNPNGGGVTCAQNQRY